MRNSAFQDTIFDTCIDTEKIFVPMNHKFVLRKDHIDKKGKSAIYLHITQNGDRDRIPVDLRVEPKYWNENKERIQAAAPNSRDMNLILENLESKITVIKTTYRLNEMHLTLEAFKMEFLNSSSRIDFIAFMKTLLDENKAIMNKNTHKAELSVWRKLRKFKLSIFFSQVDLRLIEAYKKYCLVTNGNQETTYNKNLAIIKKYLNLAVKHGVKLPIKTDLIIVGSTDGDKTNLDGEEVERLAEYFVSRFLKPNHKIPLGMFLLSCFNGLRISDAQQLTPGKIDKGRIVFTSIKTGYRHILALNLTTQGILELCPEMLETKFSDQHHNRKLKEICHMVGISKKVTFHVARHTFATNYLRLGGKVEVLQKILGHAKINETMTYVHIVQEEQDKGMEILDGLIEDSHFSLLPHNLAS